MLHAGEAQASHGPLVPLDVASVASVVRYGASADALDATARSYAVTYKELYNAMDAWCGRRRSAHSNRQCSDHRASCTSVGSAKVHEHVHSCAASVEPRCIGVCTPMQHQCK